MHNRIIIAGSRGIADYSMFSRELDKIFTTEAGWRPSEIISGHAKGIDQMAEQYAHERGIDCTVIPADWDKHGKSAGYRRNSQMLAVADRLIAFWDGASSGTKHMVEISAKKGIPIKVLSPAGIMMNSASVITPEVDGYYIAVDRTIKPCKIIGQPNQGRILCQTKSGKFFVHIDDTDTDLSAITNRLHVLLSMHVTPKPVIMTRNVAFCPTCHGAVLQDKSETKFCHRCGQAVCF